MGPPSSRRSRSSIRSPSSTSSNSHTSCTHSSSSSHPPVELIQKPVQAYFSPHRIPASYPSSPFTASTATVNECCAPRLAQPPRPRSIMGFTKSQRIGILLGIDAVFFLVELVVGYAVHSLALVADSFHMLNDVLSLCVGLWAVRVANTGASKMYTYGWQRAETLGALINGVFLVALCMSIFLEAIQRFVEPQEVSSPILILVVGCCGLASNLLGMVLLHEHEKSEPETSNIPEDMSNSGRRMAFEGINIQRKARSSRRAASLSQISIHPKAFRADVIAAAQSRAVDDAGEQEPENTPLLAGQFGNSAEPTDLHGDHIHARSDEGEG